MPRKSLTASIVASVALFGQHAWAQDSPVQEPQGPARSNEAPILMRDEIVQVQAPVLIGQTIRGRLGQRDQRLAGRTPYEEYTIQLSQGALLEIQLQADFRTYVEIYEADSRLRSLTRPPPPRLVFSTDDQIVQFEPTAGYGRTYIVRVYGDVEDERDYQISFRSATRPVPVPPPIAIGQTVSGVLNAEASQTMASGRFQEFTLVGEPGDRVAIQMRRADPESVLDPYLQVGAYGRNGVFRAYKSNDDNGIHDNGTNNLDSFVPVIVPDGDQLIIRARGWVRGSDEGPFTLSVERLPPAGEIREPRRLRVGRTEEGVLAMTDAMVSAGDFHPFQDYELRGRAGESYVVTVYSDDFPPEVSVGMTSPVGFQTVETGFDPEDTSFGQAATQQVEIQFQQSGVLTVRVTAEDEGEVGVFRLMVVRAAVEEDVAP